MEVQLQCGGGGGCLAMGLRGRLPSGPRSNEGKAVPAHNGGGPGTTNSQGDGGHPIAHPHSTGGTVAITESTM